MRVAGRQKGSKIKPYTHVVVNPNAPKSRYTFSMHSSEARAKKAAEKYSPLVGDDLKVVKQSGKSPSTDMFEATKRIPRKKGQPAGSDKHSDLYTDENPKGTIHGLKFATPADAKASVAKIKKSGRKHAHKIQAAIAMEQRARVAGKTAAAAVYRAYINKMKKKTKEMQKENIEEKNKGLWHNINQRRKSGKRMRKKGEKGAPSPEAMAQAKASSESNVTTAAVAGIPKDTKTMGPRLKTTTMHDRRRKKDKLPVLLKRFRTYLDNYHG